MNEEGWAGKGGVCSVLYCVLTAGDEGVEASGMGVREGASCGAGIRVGVLHGASILYICT